MLAMIFQLKYRVCIRVLAENASFMIIHAYLYAMVSFLLCAIADWETWTLVRLV